VREHASAGPERNASNRVLERARFRLEGEAQDDDVVVWRFSLARPAYGGDVEQQRPRAGG
jgi:hypothetical protein